jgi:hypothetical protein
MHTVTLGLTPQHGRVDVTGANCKMISEILTQRFEGKMTLLLILHCTTRDSKLIPALTRTPSAATSVATALTWHRHVGVTGVCVVVAGDGGGGGGGGGDVADAIAADKEKDNDDAVAAVGSLLTKLVMAPLLAQYIAAPLQNDG